jgi:ABC-type amino acid transport substrate-binding protein
LRIEYSIYTPVKGGRAMRKLSAIVASLFLAANVYAAEECIIKLRVNDSPYTPVKGGRTMRILSAIVVSLFLAANVYAAEECIIKLRVNDSPPSYFTITEERNKFAHFIGPHHFEIIRLIVAKDSNHHIEKHEDIKNLPRKIMLEPGTYYGEEIAKLVKDESFAKNVQWTSHVGLTPLIIEKVTLGRVSGFLSYVTPGALKKVTQEVKYHPFVINADPVYFGVSKKSVDPLTLKRLQEAVERLKARGEFEKILKKYE